MDTQAYNIQFVANITGINPHTIRAWEKRYQAITPKRDHNDRRLYIQSDIDRLGMLNALVRSGNSISDIASLSLPELQAIHTKFVGHIKLDTMKVENINIQELLSNINMGLEYFKLDIISHEIEKACNALNSRDLALEIIAPVMMKLRSLKQSDQLSTKQRESIALIIKSHVTKKLVKSRADTKTSQKIVLAAPSGQLNEIGIMVAALICQTYHLDFFLMGGNVPADCLAEIAKQLKADILFLGLHYSLNSFGHADAYAYQEELMGQLTYKPAVWVGTFDTCSTVNEFFCIDNFKKLDHKLSQL